MTIATVTQVGLTSIERDLVPMGDGFAAYRCADVAARRRMLRAARATMREFRAEFGFKGSAALLTSPDAQPKTGKNEARTLTLMLVPARSVLGNACPSASVGCGGDASHEGGCLNTSGKGRMHAVQYARLARFAFMVSWPWEAGVILAHELMRERVKHAGKPLGVRLNCVSDIRWERVAPALLESLHGDGFTIYDYTAFTPRMREGRPDWYHVTYSAKESHTVDDIRELVESGHNVAVPFHVGRHRPLPTVWHGMRVIDGDVTDWRPGDPVGVIVGLRAKGSAIGDTSGFVRHP